MGRQGGPQNAATDATTRRLFRRGWWSIDRLLIGSLVLSATAHAAVGVVAGHAEPPPSNATAMTLSLYASIDPSLELDEEDIEEISGSWDYAPEPDAPELAEAPQPEPQPEPEVTPEPEPEPEATPEPQQVAAADPVEPEPETTPEPEPTPLIPAGDPIAVTPDPDDAPDPDALVVEPTTQVAAATPDADADPSATPNPNAATSPTGTADATAALEPVGMHGGTATERVAPMTGDERRALERLRARFDRRLGARIDRSVRWPRHLLTADVEGVVVVGFRFDADGHVIDVVVVESSGHDALDEAALEQIAGLRMPDWDPALAAIDERYREVPLHFDPTG